MEEKQDQNNSGKVRKKFEQDMAALTQVLGGFTLYKPMILVPAEVQEAVKELAKEEKEKKVKEFKDMAIALINKKREHDRNVSNLKKEFEKKEEEGMKSFSVDAKKLFAILKDIKNIEKSYYDTLVGAVEGKPVVEEEAKEEEDAGETQP